MACRGTLRRARQAGGAPADLPRGARALAAPQGRGRSLLILAPGLPGVRSARDPLGNASDERVVTLPGGTRHARASIRLLAAPSCGRSYPDVPFAPEIEAPTEGEMRKPAQVALWAVYQMTIQGQPGPNVVCLQREWDAVEAASPGVHRHIKGGIVSEGE